MKNKSPLICLSIITIIALLVLPQTVSANSGWAIQVATGPDTTIAISYDQLLSLPQTTVYAELYCYGSPVTSGSWTGVKLTDLLNYAGLNPTGGSIDFTAQDGYKVSIPLSIAVQPGVIVAYEKDGIPLTETYRLVLPGSNGNLWISMITSLALGSETSAFSQSATTNLPQSANSIRTVPIQVQQTPSPTSTPTPTPPQQTPAPSNTTVLQPTTPNQTAPASGIQDLPKGSVASPPVLFYTAALATTIAVVLASFAVIRLRKRKV